MKCKIMEVMNMRTYLNIRHHAVPEELFATLGDTYPTGTYNEGDAIKWFSVSTSAGDVECKTTWFLA